MRPNLGTFVTALLAGTFAPAAWAQGLGRVHFETSCTPQAQEKFDSGLAMVHSFFYPNSVQAFTDAAAADPQCAIAYWGIAISSRPNPLILPLTPAALKNGLDAVEKGKTIGAKTERERDWLEAIELYYKDYDKVDQTERGLAYAGRCNSGRRSRYDSRRRRGTSSIPRTYRAPSAAASAPDDRPLPARVGASRRAGGSAARR